MALKPATIRHVTARLVHLLYRSGYTCKKFDIFNILLPFQELHNNNNSNKKRMEWGWGWRESYCNSRRNRKATSWSVGCSVRTEKEEEVVSRARRVSRFPPSLTFPRADQSNQRTPETACGVICALSYNAIRLRSPCRVAVLRHGGNRQIKLLGLFVCTPRASCFR